MKNLIKLFIGLLLIYIAGAIANHFLVFSLIASIIGGFISGRALAEFLDI